MTITLKPFQETGAAYLRTRRQAALFDDMGLGKTVQALAAYAGRGPCLVVCPKIAKSVWIDHAAAMGLPVEASPLSGRGSFRWPAKQEMLVLNYDILPTWPPGDVPWGTCLIADEAHYLKAWDSQRSVRFQRIGAEVLSRGGSVWVLTGTPMPNTPADLWNVLSAAGLNYQAFRSWPEFYRLYQGRKEQQRVRGGKLRIVTKWGQPKPEAAAIVRRVSLRRTRAEVLPQLPEVTRQTLTVECMTKEATKVCAAALDRLLEIDRDPEVAVAMLLDDVAGREQSCQDPSLVAALSTLRSMLSVLKIKAASDFLDDLEAGSRQAVLFSAHRAPVEAVGVSRKGWATITGSTPQTAREQAVRMFQAGELRGIAATIGAAGTAITLTAAADVVFVDRDWSPDANAQAEARVIRMGQSRGVMVTDLVADHPLDGAVMHVCRTKRLRAAATGLG